MSYYRYLVTHFKYFCFMNIRVTDLFYVNGGTAQVHIDHADKFEVCQIVALDCGTCSCHSSCLFFFVCVSLSIGPLPHPVQTN